MSNRLGASNASLSEVNPGTTVVIAAGSNTGGARIHRMVLECAAGSSAELNTTSGAMLLRAAGSGTFDAEEVLLPPGVGLNWARGGSGAMRAGVSYDLM